MPRRQQRPTVQTSGPARNVPIDLVARPASVSSQQSPAPPPQAQQTQAGSAKVSSSTALAVQNIRSHAGDREAPVSQRVGTDFPEIRSSKIDVNADPIYEPVDKPISHVDIDAGMYIEKVDINIDSRISDIPIQTSRSIPNRGVYLGPTRPITSITALTNLHGQHIAFDRRTWHQR